MTIGYDVDEVISGPDVGRTSLRLLLWDEELRSVIKPLEENLSLMAVLFPVTVAISMLIAAGLNFLLVNLLARETAILRVLGVSRIGSLVTLTGQQGLLSLLGLIFAATSIRLRGTYFAMLTLAISQAFYILIKSTDLHQWTGADEGLHGVPLPLWLNPTQNRLTVYFIALAFLLISYLVMRRITNSPTGRAFIANRENEDRMRMISFNPVMYRTIAFVIASVFAGLAGALYAIWNTSVSPSMISVVTTVDALIMTILGGMGTLIGPVIGAGINQVIQQFFYTWFGARWPLVFGLIFILIVMFFPYGIVGTWRMKQNDIKAGLQRFKLLLFPDKHPEK